MLLVLVNVLKTDRIICRTYCTLVSNTALCNLLQCCYWGVICKYGSTLLFFYATDVQKGDKIAYNGVILNIKISPSGFILNDDISRSFSQPLIWKYKQLSSLRLSCLVKERKVLPLYVAKSKHSHLFYLEH